MPEDLPTPTNSRPSHRQQTFLPSDQPTATTATESRSVDGIYGILDQIIRKLADVESSVQRRDATPAPDPPAPEPPAAPACHICLEHSEEWGMCLGCSRINGCWACIQRTDTCPLCRHAYTTYPSCTTCETESSGAAIKGPLRLL